MVRIHAEIESHGRIQDGLFYRNKIFVSPMFVLLASVCP